MFLYFLPENNWPTGLTRHETKPAEKERNAVLTRSVSAASTSSVSLPFPSVSNGLPMGLCDVLFGIEKKKSKQARSQSRCGWHGCRFDFKGCRITIRTRRRR